MDVIVWVLRLGLACVLIFAGTAKFLELQQFRQSLREFRLPENVVKVLYLAVPMLEWSTGIMLLESDLFVLGAVLAAGLLLLFALAMLPILVSRRAVRCACFGQLGSSEVTVFSVARNILLIVIAVFIAVIGMDDAEALFFAPPAIASANGTDMILLIETLQLGLLISGAVATFRLYNIVRAHPTVRENRQDTVVGLPIGVRAPSLDLRRFDDESTVSLENLGSEPNRPKLLLFTRSSCQPCKDILNAVVVWRTALSEVAELIVVAEGDSREIRTTYPVSLREALYLAEREGVGNPFGSTDVPSAIAIDGHNRIASSLHLGEPAIAQLVNELLKDTTANPSKDLRASDALSTPPADPT